MPQSRRQSIVMITSAVLAALALAPSVSAQEDGTISGTVRDATDAVLPGVTVEVRSTAAAGRSRPPSLMSPACSPSPRFSPARTTWR